MAYKSDDAYVVYCCSDLFAEVCAVSIASLFENNRHLSAIRVYIIDDVIGSKNKGNLVRLAKRYGRDISFIPLPDPTKFFNDERFTNQSLGHTYARMILGDILPAEWERVISLDCDTIVLDRIDELWNTDMGEFPIAGVDDCMGKVALTKTQHLRADAIHCNAGMYLIDLTVWRRENWTRQFFEYIHGLFDNGTELGGYEEEVITKVVGDRMLVLPPRFNLMTMEQVFTYDELMRFRQPVHYYSEAEMREARSKPVLAHTTNFYYVRKRIFESCSDHPMRPQYVKYRGLTPWKDEPAMTVARTFKQKLLKNVWHMMPRFAAIYIGRYIRNDIRPCMKKKRDDE